MKAAKLVVFTLAAVFGVAAGMFWSGSSPLSGQALVSQADARVGRPATPRSYAGVARRTTRRAVATGAAGAAAAGTYYYRAPGCTEVVNSRGQIVHRCP